MTPWNPQKLGRLASVDLDVPCLGHIIESAWFSGASDNATQVLQNMGEGQTRMNLGLLCHLIAGKIVRRSKRYTA